MSDDSKRGLAREGRIGPATESALDQMIRDRYGSWEALHARVGEDERRHRVNVVETYEAGPSEFHTAWEYLCTHPIFRGGPFDHRFPTVLSIDVVKVDPGREEITDTDADTATRVWLEAGPTYLREEDAPAARNDDVWRDMHPREDVFAQVHDPALDCGAPTFEEAILELAANVAAIYGHDRSLVHDYAARYARAPHLVHEPGAAGLDD